MSRTRNRNLPKNTFKASEEVIEPVRDFTGDTSASSNPSTDSQAEIKDEASKPNANKRSTKAAKQSLAPKAPLVDYSFIYDERFQKISGLLLLLLAAFLGIAFVSFIVSWEVDYDKITVPFKILFDPKVIVHNSLGKFGAFIAYLFLYKLFGISSFILPLISLIIGLRVLFHLRLVPIVRSAKYSFFGLVWISITLGTLFSSRFPLLGGGFGYFMNLWLCNFMGYSGTLILMAFSLLVFLVVAFNLAFYRFPKRVVKQEVKQDALPVVDQVEVPPAPSPLPLSVEPSPIVPPIVMRNLPIEPTPTEIELSATVGDVVPAGDMEFTVIEKPAEPEIPVEVISEQLPFGEYDPTLELSSYQMPHVDLLDQHHNGKDSSANINELNANKDTIVRTLNNYGIQIEKITAIIGPTVTLYEIKPVAGVRISKIKNLEDDIALSLAALGIRIIAPIRGKEAIGIEVPNAKPEMVSMRSIVASDVFQNSTMDLPIALGKTILNETYIADLAKMPHLLMAGATGQGKSVGLNAILVSLLYKKHPSQIKFVLVDPKKVELTLFNKIERHFLAKLPDSEDAIITDTKKVIHTLNSLCIEMDQRYDLLKDAQVRNIKEYNAKFIARKLNPNNGHKFLPYIVLVVDEFADLIMTAGKEVEAPIARLAQLARAIGIHLIIATQRPSVNIITGTIKANFPARIAFRVMSKIDSRTILDAGGADRLIGKGDMLLSTGSDLIRIQCAFVDTPEVEKITEFIGSQRSYPDAFLLPEFIDDTAESTSTAMDPSERDSMFVEAARIVVQHQQGSASLLQRRLKLGYNRAGRIIDQLEAAGIIGPFEGSKAREVLVKDPASLEQLLR